MSRRELVESFKKQSCKDCQRYFPGEMTFDHLPGYEKLFNVSHYLRYPKWAVKLEIAKCEVVCKRCHNKREQLRRPPSPEKIKRDSENARIGQICNPFYILRELTTEFQNLKDQTALIRSVCKIFRVQNALIVAKERNMTRYHKHRRALKRLKEISRELQHDNRERVQEHS